MNFNELKEAYEKDIELEEEMINTQVLKLPKIMAKYQFFFYDLLREISLHHDSLDKVYYDSIMSYKQNQHELSNFDFSSTELQKIMKTSPNYRIAHLKIMELENQLKLVEEMMSNIKSMSFSINNKITLIKIDNGII